MYGIAAISADDVWAVGTQSPGGSSTPLVEHYNGRRWAVTDVPLPPGEDDGELSDLSADSAHDVWAVGATRLDNPVPLAEHWNGTRWTTVHAPTRGLDPFLQNVVAVGPADVWAVGTTGQHGLMEHSSGGSFTVADVKAGARTLYGVDFISASEGMVVGSSSTERDGMAILSPVHLHWDGHSWTP